MYNNRGRIFTDRGRRNRARPVASSSFGNPAASHAAQDGVHKIYNLLSLTGKQSQSSNLDYHDHLQEIDYYDEDNTLGKYAS